MNINRTDILRKYQHTFGNILDFTITEFNSLPLDFTKENKEITPEVIADAEEQERYVFDLIHSRGRKVGVGGYLEERDIYSRSEIFSGTAEQRCIHLGVDLWIESETPVFAPLEGEVFSVKDNKGLGDYGPTIILKHRLEGSDVYTLYGHLSADSLDGIQVGDRIYRGERFCKIGNYPTNGNYAPHLHFQIITDLEDYSEGNYPGVCSKSDLARFSTICPDPNLILQIPSLG